MLVSIQYRYRYRLTVCRIVNIPLCKTVYVFVLKWNKQNFKTEWKVYFGVSELWFHFCRERPAQPAGGADEPALRSHAAPGARAGAGQTVCRDPSFHAQLRRTKGRKESLLEWAPRQKSDLLFDLVTPWNRFRPISCRADDKPGNSERLQLLQEDYKQEQAE